jgi:uncharacterized protein YkwD
MNNFRPALRFYNHYTAMKSPLTFALVSLLLGLQAYAPVTGSSFACLQDEEQKLYTLLMEYRASKGLGPIALSVKLTRVAQLHARDLAGHYDPKNTRCNLHSWSKNGTWTACCYTDDHKQAKCMWDKPREIAGYPGNGYEISYFSTTGANAEEGLEGWKRSPGHNQVIINEGIWKQIQWNAIGIGLYNEYGVVWFGKEPDDENCN